MPEAPTPLHAAMLELLEREGELTAAALLQRLRDERPELLAGIPETVVRGAVATSLRRLARRGRVQAGAGGFAVAPARAPQGAWAVMHAA